MNEQLNEQYEVWAWSPYNCDYTTHVGYYNTRREAERAAGDDDCIIIEPSRAKILHLNGELVIAVKDVHWHGGVGYVDYYSLFIYPTKKHIGFVKQCDVKDDVIDESKVIFN